MSEAPTHSAFFGDSDHTFALPVEMVTELERLTGRGIGGLVRDLFAGNFHHREILETIRLGLIGGGATPQIAAALVRAYADNRPLTETYPLAVSILETLYFGRANSTGKKKRASK
jgi:hypothetical protein